MSYSLFETFVGAGGSHIGFKNNGFRSVFVNDIDKNCLDTLLFNNPEIAETAVISNQDMTELNGYDLLEKMKMEPKELDVMFGGIVCKGFSLAGERSPNDRRNSFYRYQLELVDQIKPKISIIENVPGIVNAKILSEDTPEDIKSEVDKLWKKIENYKGYKANARKKGAISQEVEELGAKLRLEKNELLEKITNNHYLISVFEDINNIYNRIGYTVYKETLNSAAFGSYTKRDRVIIVAVRNDIKLEFKYPKPIFSNEKDYLTVGEALSKIDYTNLKDIDNIPMNHAEKTIRRFKYIKEGENLAKVIDKLPSDLKISKFYSRGSTMRLDSKKSAPTLVPGHSNFPIHPFEPRSITVREASTITGFPLNYKFFGTHSKRCEQVGNAVPPNLSFAIAKSCKEFLDKYNEM